LAQQDKIQQLQEQVALLRHKLFSPKSERSPEDAGSPQLAMFNEAQELIEALTTEPSEAEAVVAPTKPRGSASRYEPPGRDPTAQSWMWVRSGGPVGKPLSSSTAHPAA